MAKQAYKPKSKNQEHITPDRVWELIWDEWELNGFLMNDPCPIGTPYKAPCFFNGLYGDWQPWNYVNPMYEVKTLRRFYEKAKEQMTICNYSIMLLPANKTDQDWFHDILDHNYDIKWIRKRLKFKNDKHHATDAHFLVRIAP